MACFYLMIEKPAPRQIRSWTDAEQNAAAWMRYWGYTDARVTNGGPDAGVDVRSSDALAQVKFEARSVGRPQLQNLVGARGRAHAKALLFFSGAGFSAHAVDYAADMDIALFEYSLDGSMKPQNGHARRLARRLELGGTSSSSRVNGPVSVSLEDPVERPRRPSARSRWVHLGFAVLFWWGLLNGLFRSENYRSLDGILGGLTILFLALLFTWLARRAFRRQARSQDTT